MATDDDILTDLETFNDAMVHFKEAVDGKDLEHMPTIFNQLLTILKHIIETYRLTDSIDILEYAAKLIHLIQDLHSSENSTYNPEPFSTAIDQLALCLTARITNRFILSSSSSNPESTNSTDKGNNHNNNPNREIDALLETLLARPDGVEIAHEHAKYLSKYMFSLIHYVQERSIEELEHAERTSKLANNCSLASFLTTYRFLPGSELLSKTLKKDGTSHTRIQSTWMILQTHEFVGKLDSWRTYHDNVRKTVKIQWDKCLKKFQQATQTIDDARLNSKSVINLPTSSSSSSTSSDPVAHASNLSTLWPHTSLQRTASSPPMIHTFPSSLPSPLNHNETNLPTLLNDLDFKRKELQLTKHETLTILNKLIQNTENLIIESLNTYFRLTDSLNNSSSTYIPRSKADLSSSYLAYIHSLPPCSIQEHHLSIKDNSIRQIPIVIQLCCRCIEQLEGHKIKGIYRLSGVKSKVDHLCRQFVQGTELNENDLVNNYSAIVLANAVKKYLRELPVPLLFLGESSASSIAIENELMTIGKEICTSANQNSSRMNERLQQIIEQRMANDAKQALIYLLKHLHLISLSEQENQMSAANLGIVFGPTLFKSQQRMQDDTTLSTLLEAPCQAKLIEYLIVNVDDLFNSDI